VVTTAQISSNTRVSDSQDESREQELIASAFGSD
jgi:hypothetical protein